MRCYRCGHELTSNTKCTNCGADVRAYYRICNLSYIHYNEGLEKARVRDLSGAVISLTRSLKYNKRNIPARNLLGLVHFEMGDYVNALSEWIVSLNIRPKENAASGYVKELQRDRHQLSVLNRSVKKYNQALDYIANDSEDLAIIQLRHAVADSPHFIEARKLLGLLYIHSGQHESARKVLQEALQLDRGNKQVMKYLNSLRYNHIAGSPALSVAEQRDMGYLPDDADEGIVEAKRTKQSYRFLIPLLVGALSAFLLTWFLLTPARVRQVTQKTNATLVEYTGQIADLENQIAQLTPKEEEEDVAQTGIDAYEALVDVAGVYQGGNYSSIELLTSLLKIDKESLSAKGRLMYDSLYENLYDNGLYQGSTQADEEFSMGNYETALGLYKSVIDIEPNYNNGLTLLQLGISYDLTGNKDEAKKIYQQVIDNYSESYLADEAREHMSNLSTGGETPDPYYETQDSSDDGDDYDYNYDNNYDNSYDDGNYDNGNYDDDGGY